MASIRTLIAIFSYAIALCGIVPLFPWLSMPPRLALVGGILAGIWQDLRGGWPIRNWMLNIAIVPIFLFYAMQYNRANAVQPVVSVLAIMLAIRLGGEKSGRYYLQIQALSLFCLAASSLFDLSPTFLIYLGMMLLLVAVTLVLLTFFDQDNRMILPRHQMKPIISVALLMPLASLPLLVLFFPILPRTQIPLWNFASAPVGRTSGMTDRIEPGRNPNITEAPKLAFRAEMPRLTEGQPYWRGTVFNSLEGTRWVRDPAVPFEKLSYRGRRISQTIYPEVSQSRVLFALDAPAMVTLPRSSRTADGVFEQWRPSTRRISYQAESVTGGALPVQSRLNRDFYLALPPDLPASILKLAGEIRSRGKNDQQRLDLVENYFCQGNYRYSLRDLPVGPRAMELFLFQQKLGHCEFFASGFGIILRAAGVPARLVGGYQGGEYNELGGYYLVTEARAHVWIEAFIEGKGWLRVDPSSYATNAGAFLGVPKKPGLARRARLALDSFDHFWNRTIINYDFDRQVEAARSIGQRLQAFNPKKLVRAMGVISVICGTLFAIILAARQRERLWPSREERLMRLFYKLIKKERGLIVKPGEQGLFELADKIGDQRMKTFVDSYAGIVYRDRKLTDQEYRWLKQILEEVFRKD